MEQETIAKSRALSEVYKQLTGCISSLESASGTAEDFDHNMSVLLRRTAHRICELRNDVMLIFSSLEESVKSQLLDAVLYALRKGEVPSGLPIKTCSDYMTIHNLNPEKEQ